MCQFELMDPREIRIWKADYARVRISREQLKFAGTLHSSPDITKALNSRESRKVPKESRMYSRIQHQQRSQSRLQASPIIAGPWLEEHHQKKLQQRSGWQE